MPSCPTFVEAHAICPVTRVFEDPDVTPVIALEPAERHRDHRDGVDLGRPTNAKVLPRLEKEARINKDKIAAPCRCEAGRGGPGKRTTIFAAGLDRGPLRDLFLLTARPFLYVFDRDSDELAQEPQRARAALVAPAEADLSRCQDRIRAGREGPMGRRSPCRDGRLPSPVWKYWLAWLDTLGLQTFQRQFRRHEPGRFQKVRCSRGRRCHPYRLSEGFIRAEVVSFDDLVAAARCNAAPEAKCRWKARITSWPTGTFLSSFGSMWSSGVRQARAVRINWARLMHAGPTLNLDDELIRRARGTHGDGGRSRSWSGWDWKPLSRVRVRVASPASAAVTRRRPRLHVTGSGHDPRRHLDMDRPFAAHPAPLAANGRSISRCRRGSCPEPVTWSRGRRRVTAAEAGEATRTLTRDKGFQSHPDQDRLLPPSREFRGSPD